MEDLPIRPIIIDGENLLRKRGIRGVENGMQTLIRNGHWTILVIRSSSFRQLCRQVELRLETVLKDRYCFERAFQIHGSVLSNNRCARQNDNDGKREGRTLGYYFNGSQEFWIKNNESKAAQKALHFLGDGDTRPLNVAEIKENVSNQQRILRAIEEETAKAPGESPDPSLTSPTSNDPAEKIVKDFSLKEEIYRMNDKGKNARLLASECRFEEQNKLMHRMIADKEGFENDLNETRRKLQQSNRSFDGIRCQIKTERSRLEGELESKAETVSQLKTENEELEAMMNDKRETERRLKGELTCLQEMLEQASVDMLEQDNMLAETFGLLLEYLSKCDEEAKRRETQHCAESGNLRSQMSDKMSHFQKKSEGYRKLLTKLRRELGDDELQNGLIMDGILLETSELAQQLADEWKSYQEEIEQLEKRYSGINNQQETEAYRKLESDNENLRSENNGLKADNQVLQKELEEKTTEIRTLKNVVENNRRDINEIKEQMAESERRLESKRMKNRLKNKWNGLKSKVFTNQYE